MTGDNWTLQVKSLEQETQSVTVPSDASVLQLKDAIQPVFDIASERQRLIFQGKVLKDGKQLAEYANLKDGMIIHLVARPIDAPSNPSNDDPQTNTSNTSRGQASNRFPGILRPPEGYTFITIDANIGSLGGDNNNPDIGGILQNLFNGSLGRRNTQNTSTLNGQSDNNNNTQNTPMTSNRNRTRSSNLVNFDFNFNMEPTANTSLLENTLGYASALPPLELRLTRALAAIANIQTSLNGDLSDSDANAFTWSNISNASPEQNQTFRSRLRASGTSETAQIGMVLEELANVMESMTPRLRQLAQEAQSNTEQTDSEGRSETV
ncbi:uncharacterized protein BX664DRAFT_342393 [Halteromyces radiatus]|uniref:uncharacterized protein n=1 Tax=Halteromyces radiatus TaxID=101107 RepID=UPI002220B597|nr:uncharacterized protein BX664DRAFT_342393 [Halteromyces radiatus]KAI8078648.1 hypothetical protein BX664DRAFT_342393 [Halteromyces radiatus]